MYSILALMRFNPLPRTYLPSEHTSTYPMIPPPAPCSPCIQQQQQQQQQQQFHPHRTWSMGTLTWPHLSAYPSQLQTRKGSEPILDAILQQPRNYPLYLLGTSSVSRYPSKCPLPLSLVCSRDHYSISTIFITVKRSMTLISYSLTNKLQIHIGHYYFNGRVIARTWSLYCWPYDTKLTGSSLFLSKTQRIWFYPT